MCILCTVQRWSRRVATMLPWLVLPLILLWALSQLLPPSYRFEVTSPRLACVSVLLLTLFWYEILLPRLSLWRARRSARLREERRARALELQKLRKTATRRCRNCHNPYKDQNPGLGGRFMCSYCGHVSKRPVLDLPSMPMMSDCSQDWGNAPAGDPRYWLDLRCSSSEKSYSGFSWRLFSCFYASARWLWSKVFRSRDGDGVDSDHKRSAKRGENEGKAEESRGEKARRKAEEKRLARLEREMLEEEERKQREEVARLVEERRRLRDEKAEAEERSKGATPVGEKEGRQEAKRRRQERKKEKDKGSSKSNSDCEDLERRSGRECERKREFDRRSEVEKRDATRGSIEGNKFHNSEANNHASKPIQSKAKYFGRMTGGLLSSSRGFSGASFFGRSAQTPAPPVSKAAKPIVAAADQNNTVKSDAQPAPTQAMAKSATAGETRNCWTNFHRPVTPDTQPCPTGFKKSWHQLFSRQAPVSPYPDVTASSCEKKWQPELNSVHSNSAQMFRARYPPLESQMSLSQSMHFPGFSPVNGTLNSMHLPHFPAGHMPFYKEPEPTVVEEPEHFEDPCYDPDAIALLGPVSESLDNFPPDLGCGFVSSDAINEPQKKPSPIESPLSRSRAIEEKHIKHSQLSYSSVAKDLHGSVLPEATNEQGTWKMWSTPLVQDSLGLHGPQFQCLLPKENQFNHVVDQQNGGTYSPLSTCPNDHDLWLQKAPFQQLPLDRENLFHPLDLTENAVHKDLGFGSPNKSGCAHTLEPPSHSWSKEEWAPNGLREAGQTYSPTSQHVGGGGLFPTIPHVQSVWSFNQKETTQKRDKKLA